MVLTFFKHLGFKDKIKQVVLLPSNYLSVMKNLDIPLVISLNLFLFSYLTRTSQQTKRISYCYFTQFPSAFSAVLFPPVLHAHHRHPHQLQASGAPRLFDTSGVRGGLTGKEIIPRACVSATRSPSSMCQLSSPAAWHLCPHPQQGSTPGRAAWLYPYLRGLLGARTTRAEPVSRMPGQVAKTVTSQRPGPGTRQ